ncbi:MAG: helix-turn-helix domain-containing protein [Phycisphaerales bacterium JB039]
MDAIDLALRDAWERVRAKIREDPGELERRTRRAALQVVRRPVRPWCLSIRASDTRLEQHAVIGEDWKPRAGVQHTVVLHKLALQSLCAPVWIPWPGVDWVEAARRLGRHEESIRGWIKEGTLEARYWPARVMSKRGKPVAEVWARGPLDPGAARGRRPDDVWGSMWWNLADRLPDWYEGRLDREARWRRYPGWETRQRGWQWICPGRIEALPDGVRAPEGEGAEVIEFQGDRYLRRRCGRRCRSVLLPVPVCTIAEMLGEEEPLALQSARHSWVNWELARPACHRCWGVRHVSLIDRNGWNVFVTHLSGGLLQGHEVERDALLAPAVCKRAYRPSRRAPSERRAQVLKGLLHGLTYKQIAAELGVGYSTVHQHVKALYKMHGVHSRGELAAKVRDDWIAGGEEEAGLQLAQ